MTLERNLCLQSEFQGHFSSFYYKTEKSFYSYGLKSWVRLYCTFMFFHSSSVIVRLSCCLCTLKT